MIRGVNDLGRKSFEPKPCMAPGARLAVYSKSS